MNDADEIKACCADAYASDLVALLLGDSYHPGGLALTRRLANQLRLGPGERVLDVASGRGSTALLLAQEYDVFVDGVDLATSNVALATGAAQTAGLADRVQFRAGDAEHLPVADTVFDGVVCECAFCTFPNKATAAAEFARTLRPGGRLGLTDITAQPDRLPTELTSLGAWVACVADARPVEEYVAILAAAGLRVTHAEPHDHVLSRLLDQIEARLELARMTGVDQIVDLEQAPSVLAAARAAVADQVLGYHLLVAERPA